MINKEELEQFKSKIKLLEKRDIDLIVCDFDDTIFCRKHQLENSELLRNNRWNKWNDIIKDVIWIKETMNEFYLDKNYPKTISSKLRINHDLILTAWYKEIQEAKLKATKLDHINFHVVLNAEEKIIETIKYITKNLKFLPNKVIVYEDRPNYFIENKKLLENTLWIPFELILVEMIDNNTEPKITKL